MAEYVCQECGTDFRSYNPSPKFCSRECKSQSQTADVDLQKIRVLYSGGKTQAEIACALGVTQKVIFAAMRRSCHWRYDDKHLNFRGKEDARDDQVKSA